MAQKYQVYTVQYRDRLDTIARQGGTTIGRLIALNPSLGAARFLPVLPAGERLIVPLPDISAPQIVHPAPPWRTQQR